MLDFGVWGRLTASAVSPKFIEPACGWGKVRFPALLQVYVEINKDFINPKPWFLVLLFF